LVTSFSLVYKACIYNQYSRIEQSRPVCRLLPLRLRAQCSSSLASPTVPHRRAALATQFQRVPTRRNSVYQVTRRAKACATTPGQSEALRFRPFPTAPHACAAPAIQSLRVSDPGGHPSKVSHPAKARATAYNASTPPRTCSTYLGLGDSFPE
jgi:hypothetical protein